MGLTEPLQISFRLADYEPAFGEDLRHLQKKLALTQERGTEPSLTLGGRSPDSRAMGDTPS